MKYKDFRALTMCTTPQLTISSCRWYTYAIVKFFLVFSVFSKLYFTEKDLLIPKYKLKTCIYCMDVIQIYIWYIMVVYNFSIKHAMLLTKR